MNQTDNMELLGQLMTPAVSRWKERAHFKFVCIKELK
jgi:hypothetical protein